MSAERRFYIKQNDRRPAIQVQVLNPDGTPRDLSDADSVLFNMGKEGAPGPKVNGGVVTMVLQAQGIVEYRWAAGDTDTIDEYRAEFVVIDAGLHETFPHDGYIIVEVVADVA